MVLDASLLNTQHYKVRIKGKVEQPREGVAPSPTHWCSSYRKGSLRVTLDYGRQLYFLYIYIYIVQLNGDNWTGTSCGTCKSAQPTVYLKLRKLLVLARNTWNYITVQTDYYIGMVIWKSRKGILGGVIVSPWCNGYLCRKWTRW